MNHAIAILNAQLEVLKNNEPINRASGDIAQANLEHDSIESITAAIAKLES